MVIDFNHKNLAANYSTNTVVNLNSSGSCESMHLYGMGVYVCIMHTNSHVHMRATYSICSLIIMSMGLFHNKVISLPQRAVASFEEIFQL